MTKRSASRPGRGRGPSGPSFSRTERDRPTAPGTLLGLASGLALALVPLAGVAYFQSREASRQREKARAWAWRPSPRSSPRASSTWVPSAGASRPGLRPRGVEADGSMLDALARGPRPAGYLRPPAGEIITAPIGLTPTATGWPPRSTTVCPRFGNRQRGGDRDVVRPGPRCVTALAVSHSGADLALGHQDGTIASTTPPPVLLSAPAPAHADGGRTACRSRRRVAVVSAAERPSGHHLVRGGEGRSYSSDRHRRRCRRRGGREPRWPTTGHGPA